MRAVKEGNNLYILRNDSLHLWEGAYLSNNGVHAMEEACERLHGMLLSTGNYKVMHVYLLSPNGTYPETLHIATSSHWGCL